MFTKLKLMLTFVLLGHGHGQMLVVVVEGEEGGTTPSGWCVQCGLASLASIPLPSAPPPPTPCSRWWSCRSRRETGRGRSRRVLKLLFVFGHMVCWLNIPYITQIKQDVSYIHEATSNSLKVVELSENE